ncbi:Golgi phosphoprotein 3 (GPP34) [Parafrankia irregularis]|uniref:Golgi phosphoprotein 3 (GPP34) n=2 Tax=Frankiaceae TaxID=74712 RepID=A0A0S4QJ59_9ACTN|nr:GPP34 family phosphoprotein [Parafrankia sp. CH37]CUU55183.1 Golgi phosphoprotein 3 (GPP34) [Parafrankia irregularis]
MMSAMDITMAEKFLLLALDESGKDVAGVGVDVGLAASLVADLLEAGSLRFDDETLALSTGTSEVPDSPLLRSAHTAAASTGAPAKLDDLLPVIATELSPLWEQAARQLVERGVLTEKKERVALVFQVTLHPVSEPAPGQALRQRLQAVLASQTAPSPADSALLAIAHPFGLLDRLVPAEGQADAARLATAAADSTAFTRALGAAVAAARQTLLAALAASVAGGAAAS